MLVAKCATGHGIARSTVHLERINMISRVHLSAFTLYCGLLGAVSLADPLSHNSTRSNRGTVDVVDAEAIEYALIAALIGDDSDIDWSISDAATCKKNGGVWVQTQGMPGFCFMRLEGEPHKLEPMDETDIELEPPGWNSGSLDELMAMEKLISTPATTGASGEKPSGSVSLHNSHEGLKNNDPIPGIDIIVDKDPEDELSGADAIEYGLIAALLNGEFDIDSLETQQLLDELLFGGGDCNDTNPKGSDMVLRKKPGRTTYSPVVIRGGGDCNDSNKEVTPGTMHTRQGNDKVVRKRPGRTAYSNN